MECNNHDWEIKIRNDLTRTSKIFNFFLYGYLGITTESTKDDILNAVIKKAYQDAARHVLSISEEAVKESKKEAAIQLIKESLNALVEHDDMDFDCWHRKLCEKLCNSYKDCQYNNGRSFTVGISQKLVNMTLKYIYLLYCWCENDGEGAFEDSDFIEEISNMCSTYRTKFHIPLDSYIFKAIKASPNEPLRINGNEENICGLGIDRNNYISSNWSKIDDYDDYINYQFAIRESELFKTEEARRLCYGPIDWEISAWIQQSIKEKK